MKKIDEKEERLAEQLARAFYKGAKSRTGIHPENYRLAAEIVQSIDEMVVQHLVAIMRSTSDRLLLEFLNEEDVLDLFLEDREADALDPYREAFLQAASAENCRLIRERFPSVARALHRVILQQYSVIEEMLRRLDAAYEKVCAELLPAPFETVLAISGDHADAHNHGHSTVIVETDAGNIMYKPHPVEIDRKFHDFFARFFGDITRAPKVCVCDGFGFTEFIANRPAETAETAREYIYHLGGLACVITMLGSSDLHHSNFLSDGVFPVIIDYEVILTPLAFSIKDVVYKDLSLSVFASSLMPFRHGVTEMSILFAKDEGNRAAPILAGERITVENYPDDFLQGFADIYHRILEKREEIRLFVTAMAGLRVRHIYRSTSVYYRLQNKAFDPNWLADPEEGKQLVQALSSGLKRSGVAEYDKAAQAEAEALLRGDIPYFYTFTDSRDLFSEGSKVLEDFFGTDSIGHCLACLDHFSEEDLVFERELLKKSMVRVIREDPDRTESEELPVLSDKAITGEELLQHAEKIFENILADIVYTPSGKTCWFEPDYSLQTGMQLASLAFLDGRLGMAVFFAALYKTSKNEAIRGRAAEAVRKVTDDISAKLDGLLQLDRLDPNRENTSLADGLTGELLGCYLISIYMQQEKYFDLCRKAVRLIGKLDLAWEKLDIMSGIAGLLKVLCKYDRLYSLPGADLLCAKLADRLISSASIPYKNKIIYKTLSPNWALSGAGHGQSGIASALFLAGRRLNRADLTEAAMTCFAFENEVWREDRGIWPDLRESKYSTNHLSGYCSGAAGIGLNALTLGYNGSELTVDRAIRSLQAEPLLHKDFLCCGNSAVVEFLLEAGRQLNRKDLIGLAQSRMAMVIERSERQGMYNCVNFGVQNVYSPSLFYGTAGIGYEMLRLAFPDEIENLLL